MRIGTGGAARRIAAAGLLIGLLAGCDDERPVVYRPAETGPAIRLRCGGLDLSALARDDGKLQVTPAGGAPMMLEAGAPDAEGNVTHSQGDMRLVRHHDGQWTMHDGARAPVTCARR